MLTNRAFYNSLMPNERLAFLFRKYVDKTYTESEKTELMHLITLVENEASVRTLIEEMLAKGAEESRLEETAEKDILRSILDTEGTGRITALPVYRKKRFKWTVVAAASTILLLLSVSLLVYRFGVKKEMGDSPSPDLSSVVVQTTVAQRKAITLPDGTQVWLSPSSSIQYPSVFNGTNREITLNGEAFFDVAHDSSHPFVITSENIRTTVLGTSFNLQAYDNQNKIAVTVVTGKVKISHMNLRQHKEEHIEVSANQKAEFDKSTDLLSKEETDQVAAPNMLKRKTGEFVYKNEPLYKLMEDMEEYFGIRINVGDQIKNCKVVASFSVTDNPENVLEVIAIAINGRLSGDNRQYNMEGQGCL